MPAEVDHTTLPSYEPHVPDQYANIIKAMIEASPPVVRKHHAPILHCRSESLGEKLSTDNLYDHLSPKWNTVEDPIT